MCLKRESTLKGTITKIRRVVSLYDNDIVMPIRMINEDFGIEYAGDIVGLRCTEYSHWIDFEQLYENYWTIYVLQVKRRIYEHCEKLA